MLFPTVKINFASTLKTGQLQHQPAPPPKKVALTLRKLIVANTKTTSSLATKASAPLSSKTSTAVAKTLMLSTSSTIKPPTTATLELLTKSLTPPPPTAGSTGPISRSTSTSVSTNITGGSSPTTQLKPIPTNQLVAALQPPPSNSSPGGQLNRSTSTGIQSNLTENKTGAGALQTIPMPLLVATAAPLARAALKETRIIRQPRPYEDLTGISFDRPDIISLMNFVPLQHDPVTTSAGGSFGRVTTSNLQRIELLTPAGHLFRAKTQAKTAAALDAQNVDIEIVGEQYSYEMLIAFLSKLVENKTRIDLLLNIVKKIELAKDYLDLRSDVAKASIEFVVNDLNRNFSQFSQPTSTSTNPSFPGAGAARTAAKAIDSGAVNDASLALPSALRLLQTTTENSSLVDLLVEMGYNSNSVNGAFSSSKIWLQLLLQLKNILKYHTFSLVGQNQFANATDDHPTKLTKPVLRPFEIRRDVATITLVDLSRVQTAQVDDAINKLSATWNNIYTTRQFSTQEAFNAAIACAISKEMRYSHGLADKTTSEVLKKSYAYSVQDQDNNTVIDAIIGIIGNDVTEFYASPQSSLVSLSQRFPSDTNVLTFESKYVDIQGGTITPGSAYYIDSVFNTTNGTGFNTERLDGLVNLFEKTYRDFATLTSSLNMLVYSEYDASSDTDKKFSSRVVNPSDLVDSAVLQIVDTNTGATKASYSSDPMAGVYAFAMKDQRVKIALFIHTMLRVMSDVKQSSSSSTSLGGLGGSTVTLNGLNDFNDAVNALKDAATGNVSDFVLNSQLLDQIAEMITRKIRSTLISSGAAAQGSKTVAATPASQIKTVTADSIVSALSGKSGSPYVLLVRSFMKAVFRSFESGDDATVNGKTRFRGVQDTVIMMAAFDLIISFISKYSNLEIITTENDVKPAKVTTVTTTTQSRIQFGQPTTQQESVVQPATNTLLFKVLRTYTKNHVSANSLRSKVSFEVSTQQKMLMTVLSTLKNVATSLSDISNDLKSTEATMTCKDIMSIVGDKDLFNLVMSQQQIMLMANTFQDIYEPAMRANELKDSLITYLDDSIFSKKLSDAVDIAFASKQFTTTKGYNKKIMTIGVPNGFLDDLRQRVKLNNRARTRFADKQSDIITVSVYKIDMLNPILVWKPQRFLFEMSRFTVRDTNLHLSLEGKVSLDDVINAIPTRDFAAGAISGSDITYHSITQGDIPSGYKAAFDDDTYSFLTPEQKKEIAKNHVLSYLLEIYLNVMTGVPIAEYRMDLVSKASVVDRDYIQNLARVGTTKIIPPSSTTMGALHNAQTLNTHTTPAVLEKRLYTPKQFDRVFNVVIDPDDFVIDYNASSKTPAGKQLIAQMLRRGDIVTDSTRIGPVNPSTVVMHNRDKGEGDLTFDRYFVSIETFGEDVV